MKRVVLAGAVALAASLSGSTESLAQARGPSAKQVLQDGQKIESLLVTLRQQWEQDWGEEARAKDREAMRQDDAASSRRLAGMEAFLRRLRGRFRIDGKIEREVYFTLEYGSMRDLIDQHQSYQIVTRRMPVAARVAGAADCKSIGAGAGVRCLITASWPAFARVDPPRYCRMGSELPVCKLTDADSTAGELLNTMHPAVLALGLDTDPPQVRAMMVTADTLTNEWLGKLDDDKARFIQTQVCTATRCYSEMEISASPDGEAITITLKQKLTWMVTLTLTLHRDPQARMEAGLEAMAERTAP